MTPEQHDQEMYEQQVARDNADAEADQRLWEARERQRWLEANCTVTYDDDGVATYEPKE
jgi:hypothetical protein